MTSFWQEPFIFSKKLPNKMNYVILKYYSPFKRVRKLYILQWQLVSQKYYQVTLFFNNLYCFKLTFLNFIFLNNTGVLEVSSYKQVLVQEFRLSKNHISIGHLMRTIQQVYMGATEVLVLAVGPTFQHSKLEEHLGFILT